MSDTATVQGNLRQIRPAHFRLETLLAYWGLAVLLPAAAIFCLMNYAEFNAREASKTKVVDAMLEMYDNLQKACQQSEYFAAQAKAAETDAGLPARDKRLIPGPEGFGDVSDRLFLRFSSFKNYELLLLITSDTDLQQTRIFTDPVRAPDYPKPGLRAAREVMREYRNLTLSTSEIAAQDAGKRKILRSFARSIFGNYFDPLNANEDFSSGFSDMAGGNRLVASRRLVTSAAGQPLFSYIALFREADSSLTHSISLAKGKMAAAGFSCSLKIKPAIPFPFVFETVDGSLMMNGPVHFAQLMTGHFRNRDFASHLLNRGIMKHKPALYPHFVIVADPLKQLAGSHFVRPGFVIFIFLCLTLLLIKSFHQGGNVRVKIRTRLFLSVLLATALPAAIFVYYTHRHVTRDFLRRQKHVSLKIRNSLKQLELAVKAGDQEHFSSFNKFVNQIRENACTAGEPELRAQFAQGLDKTYSGVCLVRNDGMILETLDYKKAYVVKLEHKLTLTREVMYASVFRFFQFMNLGSESWEKKLQATPRGRKLLAMADIFQPLNIDNFCNYESSGQTSKQDFGNFRMRNFKILPRNDGRDSRGAVLILIQDIRELAHLIIDGFARDWSFFRRESGEGLIETAVISTFDLDGRSLDTSKVWPTGLSLNPRHLEIVRKMANGRSEAEVTFEEADGTPTIVVGLKIAGYPLLAIAECRMSRLAHDKSLSLAIIAGNLVFILLLLSVLASILTGLFTPPIDQLLAAARLTGEGELVHISNTFNNELSHLTSKFNDMNQHIKERERLERFISREATETIASESRELREIDSQRVRRSIVFMHLRGFSSINEQLAPEDLFRLMNLYFPFVEKEIIAFGGQIDKYIGDAIMAVFAGGAGPEACSSSQACQAVKGVQAGLAQLNESLETAGLPAIQVGIGVTTGEVISGRIGSYQGRLDFTVIGDRVNLAARLEAASHFAPGSHILIDEETWKVACGLFTCRFHGEIKIKGKSLPVKTYEIIA